MNTTCIDENIAEAQREEGKLFHFIRGVVGMLGHDIQPQTRMQLDVRKVQLETRNSLLLNIRRKSKSLLDDIKALEANGYPGNPIEPLTPEALEDVLNQQSDEDLFIDLVSGQNLGALDVQAEIDEQTPTPKK